MLPSDLLRCPRCAATLLKQATSLECSSCGNQYRATDTVIDLRRSVGADESPPEEHADEVSADTWHAFVRNHVEKASDSGEALYETVAVGRAAWQLLLDLRPEASVLVVGSGTGLVASCVAPHVARVVAMDFALPPLLLAAKRFRVFNPSDDITLILTDREGPLPLADVVFDFVLLSGVPDWRPSMDASSGQGSARTQIAYLDRLLKPDGQLFWAIDNRLSHKTWRSAIRQIPHREKRPDRVSLHPRAMTFFGYRNALRHAGYANPRWFSLMGTLSFLHAIETIKPSTPLWIKKRSQGIRSRLKSHPYTVDRYGILATKGGGSRGSLLERLLETIQIELPCTGPLKIEKFTISRKDKIIVFVAGVGVSLILRIPMSEEAQESDRVNARMLRALASREEMEKLVPRSLVRGAFGAVSFYVESRLAGRALQSRFAILGSATAHALAGLLMDRLNRTSGARPALELSGKKFDDEVGSRIASLQRLGLSADTLAGLHRYFHDRLGGVRLPFGTLHGDFSLSNILLDDDDRVSGLIDWESGSEESLPILDAIHYVESAERSLIHDDVGAAIPRMAEGAFVDEAGKRFLMERYDRWQIDAVHHEALVYLKWLRHMAYLSRFWLAYDPRRIDALVTPVVQAILNRGR